MTTKSCGCLLSVQRHTHTFISILAPAKQECQEKMFGFGEQGKPLKSSCASPGVLLSSAHKSESAEAAHRHTAALGDPNFWQKDPSDTSSSIRGQFLTPASHGWPFRLAGQPGDPEKNKIRSKMKNKERAAGLAGVRGAVCAWISAGASPVH